MKIRKIILIIFFYFLTIESSFSIGADVFVQSTVNRASKILSENISKDEKIALQEVDKYLSIFKNYSYIFNLGHGILPQTDPDIIRKIVDKIKK